MVSSVYRGLSSCTCVKVPQAPRAPILLLHVARRVSDYERVGECRVTTTTCRLFIILNSSLVVPSQFEPPLSFAHKQGKIHFPEVFYSFKKLSSVQQHELFRALAKRQVCNAALDQFRMRSSNEVAIYQFSVRNTSTQDPMEKIKISKLDSFLGRFIH